MFEKVTNRLRLRTDRQFTVNPSSSSLSITMTLKAPPAGSDLAIINGMSAADWLAGAGAGAGAAGGCPRRKIAPILFR